MKRGMFFTLDAFIGAVILILGMVVATTFFVNKPEVMPLDTLSHDLTGILSALQVGNVKSEYLDVLRAKGILISEMEGYLLSEFIGRLYTENHTAEVTLLMQNLTGQFIPRQLNVQIVVDGQIAYATSNDTPREVIASRRMVTGIDIRKPLSGFTSRAFIAGNGTKKEVYYDTMVGSLGYGNVTKLLRGIPRGARVSAMRIVVNAANATRWYINGTNCLNASSGMSWLFTAACNRFFGTGNDTLTVVFANTSNKGVQVLRGALIEINYTSLIAADHTAPASQRFYLDGVNGLINIKTGIYAKGTNPTVAAYLHWRNYGAGWDYDLDGDIDAQPKLLLRFGNR
ncbi:MAG TPA: hypothetical protein VJB68_02140, partial [Methylophilaceae bacterium]|nr:hypothetical protein [Methylophilaceae bacterium]